MAPSLLAPTTGGAVRPESGAPGAGAPREGQRQNLPQRTARRRAGCGPDGLGRLFLTGERPAASAMLCRDVSTPGPFPRRNCSAPARRGARAGRPTSGARLRRTRTRGDRRQSIPTHEERRSPCQALAATAERAMLSSQLSAGSRAAGNGIAGIGSTKRAAPMGGQQAAGLLAPAAARSRARSGGSR